MADFQLIFSEFWMKYSKHFGVNMKNHAET